MAVKVSPYGPKPQFVLASGLPAVGNKLFFYVAGSVNTKQNTYTDSTGLVANTNPLVLNALGEPSTEIWFTTGQSYKMVYAPSTDTDPPTSPIWTIDNLTGINDTTTTIDQWVSFTGAPTFVSATSFTLAGDQTSTFHIGRRVKTTNSGGTIYSTISNAVFGAVTTVTVVNDSGTLDLGLSAVSYGLLSYQNPSIPQIISAGNGVTVVWANGRATISSSAIQPIYAITATRASNAETITVTPATAANLQFRSDVAGTGTYTDIAFSAPITLTLSSGSTVGAINAVPFRLWIVAFNDAGTLRLGAVKTVSGTDIMNFRADLAYSATAEGGAGAADSAQVIYCGNAVTTKAIVILGYLEYTLATVGTWVTAPSKIQIYLPGTPLPGDTVQEVSQITGAATSGTTVLPADNTTPQNNEGDQYMTKAIVPKSGANLLEHNVLGHFASSTTNNMGMAMFQDATANALASSFFVCSAANIAGLAQIYYRMVSGTVVSTTFNVRAGGGSAGTTSFNGRDAGTGFFNGTITSYLKIREIMA
ncbi:MAG TPA: hypothetical protein VK663_01105 [Burkholderiales bacterium]|nr:hypothetical protein [Burkholderiales bacterium]